MDPQKDQDAVKIWWNQWRYTDKGKRLQQEMKRFVEASRKFKPVHYMARVEPNGTFAFDDMPAGDYRLDVRAMAPSTDRPIGPGEMIARLEHNFAVRVSAGMGASEPVDLGELTLQAIEPRHNTIRCQPPW